MKRFQTFGATSPEESQREKENKALARRAAAEGIVLLKNDGVLPLQTKNVALYGPGSRMTVKGGSGSGDVRERRSVTIEEGLKNADFTFPTTLWMDRFEQKYAADVATWRADVEQAIKGYGPIRTMQMFITIGEHPMPYPACTPILKDELTDETDTAIYVLSRQAGEGKDRRVEKGDYLLSEVEEESLKTLSAHYKKLILILNVGSVIDLSILDETRVDAVLFYGQGGMEGGSALADLLTGAATPCGKLTDTWAMRYVDYPSADTFGHRNGNLENEDYAEGIYVGYRWFEKQGIAPRFPFGFGLSYTMFQTEAAVISDASVTATVTNTGAFSGKEVVQLFVQKPEATMDHERRSLLGFAKTKLLKPGESETLTLPFDLWDVASFDEAQNAFVLEKGTYTLFFGDRPCGSFLLETERTRPITRKPKKEQWSERVAALLKTLSDRDKIALVTGGGYAMKAYNNVMGAAGRTSVKLLKKGVPNIVLCDGPAGLNVNQSVVIMNDGSPRYPCVFDEIPVENAAGYVEVWDGDIPALYLPGRAMMTASAMDDAMFKELGPEDYAASPRLPVWLKSHMRTEPQMVMLTTDLPGDPVILLL